MTTSTAGGEGALKNSTVAHNDYNKADESLWLAFQLLARAGAQVTVLPPNLVHRRFVVDGILPQSHAGDNQKSVKISHPRLWKACSKAQLKPQLPDTGIDRGTSNDAESG